MVDRRRPILELAADVQQLSRAAPARSEVTVVEDQARKSRGLEALCVGIGAFPAPARVLWAAPRVDRALLDLQAALHEALAWPGHPHYAPGSWVPHYTLAEDLTLEAFARAADRVARHWQPLTATLDRIDLVRFRPVEILWQHPLRSRAGA